MRSAKQRSRSKSNRQKSLGNIVNRVFDSSGPEGKVRGTPQQIIDKYQVLARDAQLSNDRVAAENFQQHAEHYTRLLAQAQREQQAEAEARRLQQEERNRQQQEERQRQQPRMQNDGRTDRAEGAGDDPVQPRHKNDNDQQIAAASQRSDVLAVSSDDDGDNSSTLVETPEAKNAASDAADSVAIEDGTDAKPVNRRKRRPAAAGSDGEEPAPKPRRNTRKPRKAAQSDGQAEVAGSADNKPSAAE